MGERTLAQAVSTQCVVKSQLPNASSDLLTFHRCLTLGHAADRNFGRDDHAAQ